MKNAYFCASGRAHTTIVSGRSKTRKGNRSCMFKQPQPPETHLKWFLSQKLWVSVKFYYSYRLCMFKQPPTRNTPEMVSLSKTVCRVLLFGVLCVRNLGASIRLHFICNCIPPSCLGTERLGKGIGRAYSKWHLTYPLSFHKYKKKTIQKWKRYKGTKV